MTAQWHLEPLPFSSLSEFFPKRDADARVAGYAILGGIPAYLNALQELNLVERRLPVTQTRAKQLRSRSVRYHLSDPYFRFYFQFLEPLIASPMLNSDQVIEAVRRNLCAFVGATAFSNNWLETGCKFKAKLDCYHLHLIILAATGAAGAGRRSGAQLADSRYLAWRV